MPSLLFALRWLWAAFRRPSNLVGLVAVMVVLLSGAYAEIQNRFVFEEAERSRVADSLGIVRAKLDGNLASNLQIVRGLAGVVAAEPWLDQAHFSALARNLFQQHSQLRSVSVAPGSAVTLVYPADSKGAAIDWNSVFDPMARAAATARDSGRLVLDGPVDLPTGGRGFVARYPIFVGGHFWGLLSAVIDEGWLLADSGLGAHGLDIEVAIVATGRAGGGNALFYGDAGVLEDSPITASVSLPSGSWQLAAIPRGGWSRTPPNEWLIRAAIGLAGALLLMPMVMARRFIGERQNHIRELQTREQQLDLLSRRLRLALDTSRVGVWEYSFTTGRIVWDDRMNELYGLPQDGGARTYADWRSVIHPEDLARAEREFEGARATGAYDSQYRLRLRDGSIRHIKAIGALYRDGGTETIVGVNWDVSADVALNEDLKRAKALTEARNAELEAAKASIEYNALHDALTNLPNRRYLDQVMKDRARRIAKEGGGMALLHLDLDRFKQINDTLGHAAGDAMLAHAACVLRTNVRESDFVARIGGDEFVVVSAQRGTKYLMRMAERIIEHMRQPIEFEGHECRSGVSVGIAYQRGRHIDPRQLLIDADIALYRAKNLGRNRVEFFTPELQAEIVNSKRMADDILAGIENREFVAHFQPQFDASTLAISGVEALARWRHPTRGMLPPELFLPIAEELDVMAVIDRMILEQALEAFRSWRSRGLEIPGVSVNVSARRLREDGLIDGLKRLDIEPGTVSFELVESIYLDERDELVAWHIDRIRELGIGIEIDDFGTGYASIISVLQLKPSRLKIDRQLVMPIVKAPERRNLIRSIVEIGHSLGIDVVAEGVETPKHTRILTELGADALQGYAFAPPLGAASFLDFVSRRAWRAA